MGSLRYASNFSAKQALQKYEDFLVADPASPCRPYAVYALLGVRALQSSQGVAHGSRQRWNAGRIRELVASAA